MLSIEYTNAFEKDVKKLKRRGKSTKKLKEIIDLLINEKPLPRKNHNHKLAGSYNGFWECHIEPDLLLIYEKIKKTLILVRLGTHSDLF